MKTCIQTRSGLTLVELMIAVCLMGLVVVATLAGAAQLMRVTRADVHQVVFSQKGMTASQRIVRIIEDGRAASVTTNGLEILMPNGLKTGILLEDVDRSRATVEDNALVFWSGAPSSSTRQVLCRTISEIHGEPMFDRVASNSSAVRMSFHVGDSTNSTDATLFSKTGLGCQGVEIRLSATPRNQQRRHD